MNGADESGESLLRKRQCYKGGKGLGWMGEVGRVSRYEEMHLLRLGGGREEARNQTSMRGS